MTAETGFADFDDIAIEKKEGYDKGPKYRDSVTSLVRYYNKETGREEVRIRPIGAIYPQGMFRFKTLTNQWFRLYSPAFNPKTGKADIKGVCPIADRGVKKLNKRFLMHVLNRHLQFNNKPDFLQVWDCSYEEMKFTKELIHRYKVAPNNPDKGFDLVTIKYEENRTCYKVEAHMDETSPGNYSLFNSLSPEERTLTLWELDKINPVESGVDYAWNAIKAMLYDPTLNYGPDFAWADFEKYIGLEEKREFFQKTIAGYEEKRSGKKKGSSTGTGGGAPPANAPAMDMGAPPNTIQAPANMNPGQQPAAPAQPAQPQAQQMAPPPAQPAQLTAQQQIQQPVQPVAQPQQMAPPPAQPVAPSAQPAQPVMPPLAAQPAAQPVAPPPAAQPVQPNIQPPQPLATPTQPVAQPVAPPPAQPVSPPPAQPSAQQSVAPPAQPQPAQPNQVPDLPDPNGTLNKFAAPPVDPNKVLS